MFKRRGILVHPEELDEMWLNQAADAGLNVMGIHPVGGSHATDSLAAAIAGHNSERMTELRALAQKRGLQVEYEAHTAGWLLDRTLFATEPAWFRMNDRGERTPDKNMCLSNAEALSYVSERAARLAEQLKTGSHRCFYWMDDSTGSACVCPDCAKLSPSDQQMLFVNAVLRGLRKVDPEARAAYIAYGDAMEAPRKVTPEDGVLLEYAPIYRDSHVALEDKSCDKNMRETRSLNDLLACFGTRDAQVLEYWMDNSRFSGWTKPPKRFELDEEVMKRDVDYYDRLGFESVTSFGCYLGADYRALYGEPPISRYGEILSRG